MLNVLGWVVVGVWGLILLASARVALRRLPPAGPSVPTYQLWLPEGGPVPLLEPAPAGMVLGPTPPVGGAPWILVLGADVAVRPDLPARLAACGADFVGVLPIPTGGPLALARERVLRDLAGVEQVLDLRRPEAAADGRCAWLRLADLALPGVGTEPVLRVARARKAHGLPVELRDGRAETEGIVATKAMTSKTFSVVLPERAGGMAVRAVLTGLPILLVAVPAALLVSAETRAPALLAFGLGAAARLMTALRDGFGGVLAVVGPLVEPIVALEVARAPRGPRPPGRPALPEGAPQELTAARATTQGRWLDRAAVPYLARRLGGAARVMEQLYGNQPAGAGRLGPLIDAAVHASPGARAVRHRLLMTIAAGRALAPQRLLSVPCGGARDAAAIGAPETVLVDPDETARALATAACPTATVVAGTLDQLPLGIFDVVLFVGLAEYLDERTLQTGLVALRERLAPGGALIATTTAEHPGLATMRRQLGWDTRGRSPEDLVRALTGAGFRVESRRCDPLGIQWLLVARSAVQTLPEGQSWPTG